jgi:hypothetical protein
MTGLGIELDEQQTSWLDLRSGPEERPESN